MCLRCACEAQTQRNILGDNEFDSIKVAAGNDMSIPTGSPTTNKHQDPVCLVGRRDGGENIAERKGSHRHDHDSGRMQSGDKESSDKARNDTDRRSWYKFCGC
ncbi:hypothetical protein PENARI_c049G12347 [Penicillium arizonense]|uniref:Uncharacterized protein n=1 Tax=Penicillium arizonense TaxID=1835702 RepID=A0A1F5L2V7_PENAI|nr:hypothetical protein PENARI_c049G12347 [Penicillium arizonense]OGE47340.1 hypothetical protein PENARI_c049G12347 [Penicillium arizonense]